MVREGWFAEAGLESVEFPATVRKIERCAFWGAKQLSILDFARESQLEEVGEWTFAGCGLVRVKLPRSIKRIGYGAFEGCSQLKSLKASWGARVE